MRGVPQIEVTFDIDANGIVHVSAKDLGTGKEQQITITSSTNMSKEDIEKAVKESEQFAEEDKKRREETDLRNNADQMVYQSEKTISDMGDKLDANDKTELQQKIDALKEALKGTDVEAIKTKQEDLQRKFYDVSAKVYQAAQAAQAAQQGQPNDAQQSGSQPNNDNVVDADYKEVDDDKK